MRHRLYTGVSVNEPRRRCKVEKSMDQHVQETRRGSALKQLIPNLFILLNPVIRKSEVHTVLLTPKHVPFCFFNCAISPKIFLLHKYMPKFIKTTSLSHVVSFLNKTARANFSSLWNYVIICITFSPCFLLQLQSVFIQGNPIIIIKVRRWG